MKIWLRSLILNISIYGWTAFLCLALLLTLLLPRQSMTKVVCLWLSHIAFIERYIGGIKTKVVGAEFVPKGACIIAAKHQSAWETFKLHLLFGDPAIVLKEELLNIPVWGWYVRRAGMIPIDRARGSGALHGMMQAAHKAANEGRKIVIFPQGTRVPPGEVRAYKNGVAALYEELKIPVVPMALNSGVIWPKNSFLKKSGTITVEFLPPIEPGLSRTELLTTLKEQLETATNRLVGTPT